MSAQLHVPPTTPPGPQPGTQALLAQIDALLAAMSLTVRQQQRLAHLIQGVPA